ESIHFRRRLHLALAGFLIEGYFATDCRDGLSRQFRAAGKYGEGCSRSVFASSM
ncbi:MAG: hypothetical protein ACI9HK_001961, partial [Pirellulaceae bacterium]